MRARAKPSQAAQPALRALAAATALATLDSICCLASSPSAEVPITISRPGTVRPSRVTSKRKLEGEGSSACACTACTTRVVGVTRAAGVPLAPIAREETAIRPRIR